MDGLTGKTLEEIEKAAIHATLRSVNNKTEAAKHWALLIPRCMRR